VTLSRLGMSGLFRRKRNQDSPPAADAAPTAILDPPPPPPPEVQATVVQELAIPAGADLDKLVGPVPSTRRRGKLRRRLRHLRGVREVLLRDLGGMVFEVHRAERTGDDSVQTVVAEKLARLAGVDRELRDLEAILDDRRGMVVREPGISGTCPNCGELFGSEARFCWACGTPVAPGALRPPGALPGRYVESTAVQLPPPPTTPPPPPPAAA
jgi:hypothetical protein